MTESDKPEPRRTFNVSWPTEDLDRIAEAARVKSEMEHMEIGPADIVRAGTRRYVEELIGEPASPAT